MKRALNKVLYIVAYGFWCLIALLPLPVPHLLSDGLYLLVSRVVKYRHEVIWTSPKSGFSEKTDDELRRIKQGFYHWPCDYTAETLKLMTMSKMQLMKCITFTGAEELSRVLFKGKSAVVCLGHLGNWEWITSLPYWINNTLCCQLYHPLENKYFDRLFKFVREYQGTFYIPMQESLRKVTQLGRSGKSFIVGYMSDQAPLWWSICRWAQFMNQETPVPTGGERIAKHMSRILVYGGVTRTRRGHYDYEFRITREGARGLPDCETTDLYFKELERSIRHRPEIYLRSHNRWKHTRTRFDEYFEEVDGKVRLREGKGMIH